MIDSREARTQQLGSLDEDQLITSDTRYARNGFGLRPPSEFNSIPGFLNRGQVPIALQLLFFALFAVFLVAIIVQVSKIPSTEDLEQDQANQRKIDQALSQLRAGVDSLCRLCPWEWTFFHGNCYFFSKSQRSWHDSITACQDMGAQLVIIKSAEEQSFLQQTSKKNGYTWMGLSDLNKESTWNWVDGSPLSDSLEKYWNKGQPNNFGGQDCVEFRDEGWNDAKCDSTNFWICKKPATSSCPSK